MVKFLYHILTALLSPILRILALFNHKLKEREQLSHEWLRIPYTEKNNKKIWFHAASMGEFEQAKPIIEYIKSIRQDLEIIVSFFSPSGYRTQKNYPFADDVFYFPFDTLNNAKKLISKLKPNVAIFIRYELWLNILSELKSNGIPAYLINATFPGKKNPVSNPMLLEYYKKCLDNINCVVSISDYHDALFKQLKNALSSKSLPDSRFDRIVAKVKSANDMKVLINDYFPKDRFVLVAGSTWEADEVIVSDAIGQLINDGYHNLRVIIVPHEPTKEHLERSFQLFKGFVTLSEVISNPLLHDKSIIVDSIGKLLSLYSYANIAYVGGGFGVGVHSVAEPAGYGIPVACGKNCSNSPDAANLQNAGSLTVINNESDLYSWIKANLDDEEFRFLAGVKSREYIENRTGSSIKLAEMILDDVK